MGLGTITTGATVVASQLRKPSEDEIRARARARLDASKFEVEQAAARAGFGPTKATHPVEQLPQECVESAEERWHAQVLGLFTSRQTAVERYAGTHASISRRLEAMNDSNDPAVAVERRKVEFDVENSNASYETQLAHHDALLAKFGWRKSKVSKAVEAG